MGWSREDPLLYKGPYYCYVLALEIFHICGEACWSTTIFGCPVLLLTKHSRVQSVNRYYRKLYEIWKIWCRVVLTSKSPSKELSLDHNVAVKRLWRHHLALKSSLYQALLCVGGFGDDKPKIKVPFLKAASLEKNPLLQFELFHGFHLSEIDFPWHCSAFRYLFCYPCLRLIPWN